MSFTTTKPATIRVEATTVAGSHFVFVNAPEAYDTAMSGAWNGGSIKGDATEAHASTAIDTTKAVAVIMASGIASRPFKVKTFGAVASGNRYRKYATLAEAEKALAAWAKRRFRVLNPRVAEAKAVLAAVGIQVQGTATGAALVQLAATLRPNPTSAVVNVSAGSAYYHLNGSRFTIEQVLGDGTARNGYNFALRVAGVLTDFAQAELTAFWYDESVAARGPVVRLPELLPTTEAVAALDAITAPYTGIGEELATTLESKQSTTAGSVTELPVGTQIESHLSGGVYTKGKNNTWRPSSELAEWGWQPFNLTDAEVFTVKRNNRRMFTLSGEPSAAVRELAARLAGSGDQQVASAALSNTNRSSAAGGLLVGRVSDAVRNLARTTASFAIPPAIGSYVRAATDATARLVETGAAQFAAQCKTPDAHEVALAEINTLIANVIREYAAPGVDAEALVAEVLAPGAHTLETYGAAAQHPPQ